MTSQTALVLLHGHGVDASIWDGIYAELASGRVVVKPDFSTRTTHETIQAYAEELYSILQTARLEQVVLVGHSMGGYIALAFAEAHPDLVRGLVLFHSTAQADDEAKKEQRQKAVGALQDGGTAHFIEELMPKMVAGTYPEADRQSLINRYSQLPAEALQAGIRAMAARSDRTHVLKQASFPVLLIAGEADSIIPPDKSRQLTEAAPNVELAVLKGAGHLGMLEQPAESVRLLQSFLAGL